MQVGILGTADDVLALIGVAKRLAAQAVTEQIPLDDPPEAHDPEELFRANPDRRLYLLPDGLAPVEIFPLELIDRPGEAKVNIRTSPVVELIPPQIDGRAMRSGRIYLGVSSSDSLYRHAKRLYDALKRHTDSWSKTAQYDTIRVGPRAAELVAAGELVLHSNTGEPVIVAGSK